MTKILKKGKSNYTFYAGEKVQGIRSERSAEQWIFCVKASPPPFNTLAD